MHREAHGNNDGGGFSWCLEGVTLGAGSTLENNSFPSRPEDWRSVCSASGQYSMTIRRDAPSQAGVQSASALIKFHHDRAAFFSLDLDGLSPWTMVELS